MGSRSSPLPRWLRSALFGALAFLALAYTAYAALRVTFVAPIVEIVSDRACRDFDTLYFGAKAVTEGHSFADNSAMLALADAEVHHARVPPTTTPVFSMLPFLPLLGLRYITARVVWHIFSVIALLAAFATIRDGMVRAAGRRSPATDATLAVLFLCLVAYSDAVRSHFCNGQTNIQMLLLVAIAASATVSRWRYRDPISGVAIALGILSKVFPAVVLPVFVAAGRWRVVAWTAVATVGLAALGLPWTGWRDYVGYPKHLSETYYFGSGPQVWWNYSLKRQVSVFFAGSIDSHTALTALAAAPLAYVYGRLWFEGRSRIARPEVHFLARYWQALALMGCVMSSYWPYHIVLAFGAMAIVVGAFSPRERASWIPLAGIVAAVVFASLMPGFYPSYFITEIRCVALVVTGLSVEIVARDLAAERLPPDETSLLPVGVLRSPYGATSAQQRNPVE